MVKPNSASSFTLESVRDSLIRQEDTILLCLIERAQFPINSTILLDASSIPAPSPSPSPLHYFVNQSEALQAKIGRYENPEEHPFFPDDLPSSLMPPQTYPQFLYPAAASVNINKMIWDFYFEKLLPLFVAQGDDGNYASSATWDLECLQALSRRIHYGKFVAEVKFRDSPQDYEPAIHAQDREALMKLLTFESVEKMVMQRVEKKAMIFGQQVSLNGTSDSGKYKVDPSIASRLYAEWVMPLTKLVQEIECLLCLADKPEDLASREPVKSGSESLQMFPSSYSLHAPCQQPITYQIFSWIVMGSTVRRFCCFCCSSWSTSHPSETPLSSLSH